MTYFRSEVHGFRCDSCDAEVKEEISEEPDSCGSAFESEEDLVASLRDDGWTYVESSEKHFCPSCSRKRKDLLAQGLSEEEIEED